MLLVHKKSLNELHKTSITSDDATLSLSDSAKDLAESNTEPAGSVTAKNRPTFII